MKKFIRCVLLVAVITLPFLAIYSGSKAQGPGKLVPVGDGVGLEPQPVSALPTQDISDEISIKVKTNNASSLTLVLVY